MGCRSKSVFVMVLRACVCVFVCMCVYVCMCVCVCECVIVYLALHLLIPGPFFLLHTYKKVMYDGTDRTDLGVVSSSSLLLCTIN